MSNTSKKGTGAKAARDNYKQNNHFARNRKRKLLKQQKLQPNNKQVELALQDIHYRRKTPTTTPWSSSKIAIAKLYKEFHGSFDMDIFHPDEKKRAAALQQPSKRQFAKVPVKKSQYSEFSIATRLANGREGLQWTS